MYDTTDYMTSDSMVDSFTTASPIDFIGNLSQHNVTHVATREQWEVILDKVATVIMTNNTICLMIGMGAATYWKDVVNNLWPPIGILIGMAGQFLVLPLLGFAFSVLFNLRPYEAIGVLIVSCSPGGSFSNFMTYWMDGELALSIVMTTCSSIMAFGGMPFNLWMYSQYWLGSEVDFKMPYMNIMISLLFVTIPVAIGMIVRHFSIKIAGMITRFASILSFVGLSLVTIIWLVLYYDVFVRATGLLWCAAFLLPVSGFTMAYILAKVFCRTHKICRTIGIETGSQNMPVSLSIILLSFSDPMVKAEMIVFPTIYGILLFTEIFIAIFCWQFAKKKCFDPEDEYPAEHVATVEKGSRDEIEKLNMT